MTRDVWTDAATLGRLELARLAAFWRFALRDGVFVLGVVAAVPVVAGGLHSGLRQAAAAPPLELAAVFTAIGAALVFLLCAGGAAKAALLWDGPFHALLLAPGRARAWTLARAAIAFAPVSLVLMALAASVRLSAAAPVLAGLWLGAVIGAVWTIAAGRRTEGRTEPVAKPSRPDRLTFRSPSAIIAHSTLRERAAAGLGALALIGVGGLAAGLAQRNNDVAGVGYLICAVVALIAGALLQPRARLATVLGQQPIGFLGLFLWLYALPLATAAIGGFVAAMVGGLGPVAGLQAGLGAVTFLFILAWFGFLHRMIRSPRRADEALFLEGAGMMLMASVETSLAPLWVAARGLILVRAARRRRWLNR